MPSKYFHTDVFARQKYSGNQLATFLSSGKISQEEMQRIAREINFSESTFIVAQDPLNNSFRVRIFTPLEEVEFAGHPVLGTAYVIQNHILKEPAGELTLDLNAGKITVEFNEDLVWMRQLSPVFGEKFDRKMISAILSLDEDDMSPDLPVAEVSTGLPVTIAPVKNLAALKKAVINRRLYWEFARKVQGRGILVFCKEGYHGGQDFAARFFADCYGIPEDPATGSANGCLAAYLLMFSKDLRTINAVVGQGYEIGRPSEIYIQADKTGEHIDVRVGGRVFLIAQGMWG